MPYHHNLNIFLFQSQFSKTIEAKAFVALIEAMMFEACMHAFEVVGHVPFTKSYTSY